MKSNKIEFSGIEGKKSIFKSGLTLIGIWKLSAFRIFITGILNLDAGNTFGFDTSRDGFILQGTIKLIVGSILLFKAGIITETLFKKTESKRSS